MFLTKLSPRNHLAIRCFNTAAILKHDNHSHNHSHTDSETNDIQKPCTKFHPNKPTAKILRHLRFTLPLDYSKGQQIQENFASAFIQFKKMNRTIDSKLKELEKQSMTTNDYETELLSSILNMKPSPTILSFQFNPIFTAGRREKYRLKEEDINRLKSIEGYDFIQTNRGGEITFHNPGQVVIYPIFDLKDFDALTIKCFVSKLEDAIIATLKKFGVHGERTGNTGVWVNPDVKISSIGLSVSRSVTSHGISINVNNEIPPINDAGFVFCGLEGKTQTSMKEQLGKEVDVNEVASEFVRQLSVSLGIQTVESVDLEDLNIDQDSNYN